MTNDKDRRVIRASEVSLYAYCARAWWLAQVEGYRSVNQAALEAGQSAHQAHGRAVARYHWQRQIAYVMLGLAFLAGVILLVTKVLR
jgi:CRISPR/Cas system-associated exonuclease Cas4 (RecB family)